MKNGKICFIHFRNTNDFGLSGKGGATLAYRIADNGDMMVAVPAVCSLKDNYNKMVGRSIATINMRTKPMAIVIPAAEYVPQVSRAIAANLSFPTLTRKAQDALIQTAQGMMDDDIHSFVNSSWFESLVLGHVIYDENKVFTRNGNIYGAAGRGKSGT